MTSPIMRWLATVLILLAGLFILLLALGAHLGLVEARKLVAEGRQTEGTVSELVAAKGSTDYRYGYTYSVGTSRLMRTNQSIPFGEKDKLRPGTKIRVWYDPANPEHATAQAELAEQESWGNRIVFPLIGAALIGWGVARIFRRKPA